MEDEPPKNWVRWETVDKYPELVRRLLRACDDLREHLAARGIYPKGMKDDGTVR